MNLCALTVVGGIMKNQYEGLDQFGRRIKHSQEGEDARIKKFVEEYRKKQQAEADSIK